MLCDKWPATIVAKIIVDSVRVYKFARVHEFPGLPFPPPPPPNVEHEDVNAYGVIDLWSKDILSLTTLKRGSGSCVIACTAYCPHNFCQVNKGT